LKRFAFILTFLLILWRPAFGQYSGYGLNGVYYTTINLTSAAVTENDPFIAFLWDGCQPEPGMSPTVFSAQWTGEVVPSYSEPYTFTVYVAGGVSLIVNNQVLISSWTDGGNRQLTGNITLTAGTPVSIVVDYFTNGGNATADHVQLGWQSTSQVAELVPHQYLLTGAALNPTPTPQTPSSCQSYASGITVNGTLAEWPWATGGWNTVSRTVVGNVFGTTAAFKTLWDASNFYLGVTVTDNQVNSGASLVFDNSAVELFLDTTDTRSVTTTTTDFQYFFPAGSPTPSEGQGRTTGVTLATATVPGGYVVEASIPWSTLGLGSPGAGKVMGFDIGVDVNHNGGQCRDGQLIWNGGSDDYIDAGDYAQLSLTGPCPTPVSTPPGPVDNNPYVSPNPTDGGSVKFVYDMAEVGTANIKVWNAWGNLAATIAEPKGAGEQSTVLNVTGFAPGHYFYRIELDYNSGKKDTFKTQVLAVKK